MSYPNEHTGTFAGTAGQWYELDVSPQYTTNRITVPTLAIGSFTAEAKIKGNTRFETVSCGTIDLSKEATILIEGYDIEAFRFSLNLTNPFTVYVVQSEPIKPTP